jgi:hypothetical protein
MNHNIEVLHLQTEVERMWMIKENWILHVVHKVDFKVVVLLLSWKLSTLDVNIDFSMIQSIHCIIVTL